jgi:CRP-like cAMP-binding protein
MAARLTIWPARAGTVLVQRGDLADRFFIVTSGKVAVLRNGSGSAPLAILGPGQFFGEMSLLTEQPRSATIMARTDVVLLTLDRESFGELVDRLEASEATSDDVTSRLAAARRADWDRATHLACHAVAASQGTITAVDVVGRPSGEDRGPLGLLRLSEHARRIALDYGLALRLTWPRNAPALHISRHEHR